MAGVATTAWARGDTVILQDGTSIVGDSVLKETVEEVRLRKGGKLAARKVLRVVHGAPPASFGRGEGAILAGRYQLAVTAFAEAEKLDEPAWVKPYAQYYRAEALRRWGAGTSDTGRLGTAADVYEQFLEAYPEHFLVPAARYGLGDALLEKGDIVGARGEFDVVADRKYGDYWELWGKLGKGLCALAQAQYTEALTEFETTASASRRPGFGDLHARAQVAKGETYMAKRDYDRAIKFYEDLAARGQGQSAQGAAAAYVSLAKAYGKRNRNDDKRKALKTYIAVTIYYAGAPEAYAEALYAAAALLRAQNESDRAEALIRELTARCPDSSWAKKAR